MKPITPVFAALTIVVVFAAAGVSAQNLLPDPGFDDPSLADWPEGYVVDGVWAWDDIDHNDDAVSGSGRFDNLHIGAVQYTITAGPCINGIGSANRYDGKAWVLFPIG